MALSANMNRRQKERTTASYPVAASATIYKGSLVCVDTAGYARAGANTAGYQFVGIALDRVVCSATAGSSSVVVDRRPFLVAKTTSVIGDVGQLVYLSDDATVATSTSNKVLVGRAFQVEDSTQLWVDPEGMNGAKGEFNFGTVTFVGSIGGQDSGLRGAALYGIAGVAETGIDATAINFVATAASVGLFTLEAYVGVAGSGGVMYAATNTVVAHWFAATA